jgi:hypothetical protein
MSAIKPTSSKFKEINMNDFTRETATTAIVVCNDSGIANAVEEDVFEQYEEAELLTSVGGENWFVLYDSTSGYEQLQRFDPAQ